MPLDVDQTSSPVPDVKPAKSRPKSDPTSKPKTLPPFAVILHNDPINGFDYVVRTLCKVFRYGVGKSFWLTMRAHVGGRALVWSGHRELAELKADQLRGCGPDPKMLHRGAGALRVTTERMPG